MPDLLDFGSMTGGQAFVLALGILPPAQRRLWDELTAIPEAFVQRYARDCRLVDPSRLPDLQTDETP